MTSRDMKKLKMRWGIYVMFEVVAGGIELVGRSWGSLPRV